MYGPIISMIIYSTACLLLMCALILVTGLTFGSEVRHRCRNGYHVQAYPKINVQTQLCSLNSTWAPKNLLSCVRARCKDPGTIENGRFTFCVFVQYYTLIHGCDTLAQKKRAKPAFLSLWTLALKVLPNLFLYGRHKKWIEMIKSCGWCLMWDLHSRFLN